MTEENVLERVDELLTEAGCRPADGEEFTDPPLDVLAYYTREQRLMRLPVLGRSLSVVAVVRQPRDLGRDRMADLILRVGRAAHGAFPPWPRGVGLTLGLCVLILTPEPIRADEEEWLERSLLSASDRKRRAVPIGCLRINPGQGALAVALRPTPKGVYEESRILADGLGRDLGRFLPVLPL